MAFGRSGKNNSSRSRACGVFTHGVIPGIEPYSGPGNQLSKNRQGPPHGALQPWRAAMEQYVGLDVSLKMTAICIVDRTGKMDRVAMLAAGAINAADRSGKIDREGMVASDPAAIAA